MWEQKGKISPGARSCGGAGEGKGPRWLRLLLSPLPALTARAARWKHPGNFLPFTSFISLFFPPCPGDDLGEQRSRAAGCS